MYAFLIKMTVLFLSSYSSNTANGRNQKKGYISSFIFPFLKIYKKSLLHFVNIKDLNTSKQVLNVYNEINSGDICFIIKTLKLAYTREQNINKKKWISNQLKRIACFIEFKSNSNYNMQTNVFLEKNKTPKNLNLFQETNIMHMHDVNFPRKNSVKTKYPNFIIHSTQNKKFPSLNSRLDPSQDDLLKFNKKGLHMSVSFVNDRVDPRRNNYLIQNHNMLMSFNNSYNLFHNLFEQKRPFSAKSNAKYSKRCHFENDTFVRNHSRLELLDVPIAPEIYLKNEEGYSPEAKNSCTPAHLGNEISNIFTENSRGNIIRNDVNCGMNRYGGQFERIKSERSLTFYQGNRFEKKFERQQQRIRLSGPFGYRLVSR